MKRHYWSDPIGVYETISGWKCRACGVSLIGAGYPDPSEDDLKGAGIPQDCRLSVFISIHEDFKPFTQEDCWSDEDWPPKWPSRWEKFLEKIQYKFLRRFRRWLKKIFSFKRVSRET